MTSYLDKQPAQSPNSFNDSNEDSALLADLQAILTEGQQVTIPLDHGFDNDNQHNKAHHAAKLDTPVHSQAERRPANLIEDQCDKIYVVEPNAEEPVNSTIKPNNDFYRDYKDNFDNDHHETASASNLKVQRSTHTEPPKPLNSAHSEQVKQSFNKPVYEHIAERRNPAALHEALAGANDKFKHDENQAPATNDVGMAMVVLSQFRTKQDSINKQYEVQLQDYKDRAKKAVFICYLVSAIGITALLFSLVLWVMQSEMHHEITDLSKSTAQLNKELLNINEKIAATEVKNTQLAPVTAMPLATVPAPPGAAPVEQEKPTVEAQNKLQDTPPQTQPLSPAAVISRTTPYTAAKLLTTNTAFKTAAVKPAVAAEKPTPGKTVKKAGTEATPVASKPKPAAKTSEMKTSTTKPASTSASKPKPNAKPASTATKPAPTTQKATSTTTKPKAKPSP